MLVFSMTNARPIEIQNDASTAQASSTLPIRLKIPHIGVDALIEQVGTTARGAMGAPAGPHNVGLWSAGTLPGQVGSAVMDGHSGWKDGIPAVFDRLDTLKIGDLIYVENAEGHRTTFVVRTLTTYNGNDSASDIFSSRDGKAHLNLITCEGAWNATEKSYTNRLVVFADMLYGAGI